MINYISILLIITSSLLILSSCQNNNSFEPVKENSKTLMPFLLDTTTYSTTVLEEYKNRSNYIPLYFGSFQDTIIVDYNTVDLGLAIPPSPPPPEGFSNIDFDSLLNHDFKKFEEYIVHNNASTDSDEYLTYNYEKDYLHWENAKLSVYVDTNQIIKNIDLSTFQDNTFAFLAYPVIITNNTDTTVSVGYGEYISLIMEAKNKNGIWEPIDKHRTYACGTDVPDIVLPKNKCVITSVKIFKIGPKTDLRLKIGDNTSNTFRALVK